ncbi:hypothetical protein GQ44DRAFT_209490 [Phaeosphaeriaceae sp. PMI808]|nr:hypothetical protein GQ44DRAFT_209490 [Phaeosphaeriaceae sp. PMI808]
MRTPIQIYSLHSSLHLHFISICLALRAYTIMRNLRFFYHLNLHIAYAAYTAHTVFADILLLEALIIQT